MSSKKQDLVLVLSKESIPRKDVGITVNKTTVPVYAEQSNDMVKCHLSPLILFPAKILEDVQQ